MVVSAIKRLAETIKTNQFLFFPGKTPVTFANPM